MQRVMTMKLKTRVCGPGEVVIVAIDACNDGSGMVSYDCGSNDEWGLLCWFRARKGHFAGAD